VRANILHCVDLAIRRPTHDNRPFANDRSLEIASLWNLGLKRDVTPVTVVKETLEWRTIVRHPPYLSFCALPDKRLFGRLRLPTVTLHWLAHLLQPLYKIEHADNWRMPALFALAYIQCCA
jgi:hypothetical protein